MMPILSVVVCTYNRSFWLRNCLDSLVGQCGNAELVEVLIIDNNSTDDTGKVAEEYTSRLQSFRYFIEPSQGLSYARNRGYREAHGQLVAYIDDDAKAHSDWVESIVYFFKNNSNVTAVGGPYNAFSTSTIPDWFPKEYGRRSLGEDTRAIKDDEWISGTNMIFRKQSLEKIGGFNTALGMTGDKVSYGEETNLIRRMKAEGGRVFYCPYIVVDHAILPYKLSLRWLLKSSYQNGKDGVKTFDYKGSSIRFMLGLMKEFLRSIKLFLLSDEKYMKTRIYRSSSQFLWQFGFFVKLLGI